MTTNKIIIISLAISLLCFNTINKKLDDNKEIWNISKKLDMIVSNQEKIWLKDNELKIDSLEKEMMDLGGKLDSMILEHDYGFVFTN